MTYPPPIEQAIDNLVAEVDRQKDNFAVNLNPRSCRQCGHLTHGPAGCPRTVNRHMLRDLIEKLIAQVGRP